jgi:hypothetical protein
MGEVGAARVACVLLLAQEIECSLGFRSRAARTPLPWGEVAPKARVRGFFSLLWNHKHDAAVRLGRHFGDSAQFWMDLQGQYDIAVVERDKGAEITRTVRAAAA